jgi:hypothetical protein
MHTMTGSSPADLAVTFRSLPRRRREAMADAELSSTRVHDSQLDASVARAATVLGCRQDASAVADAIDATPANAWTSELLDELRAIALQIGATLRSLADVADADSER